MKKILTPLAVLGFGAALAGCSSNNTVTPGTPYTANAQYTQIERLSRPAIKEVFETFVQHQASNASEPYNDSTIAGAIQGTEDALRPPVSGGSDYGAVLKSVLYPDWYTVNLNGSVPTSTNNDPELFLSYEVDGSSYFGGRSPNDDVIDLELPTLFGHILPKLGLAKEDNEENDCLSTQNLTAASTVATTATFPYLAGPHP